MELFAVALLVLAIVTSGKAEKDLGEKVDDSESVSGQSHNDVAVDSSFPTPPPQGFIVDIWRKSKKNISEISRAKRKRFCQENNARNVEEDPGQDSYVKILCGNIGDFESLRLGEKRQEDTRSSKPLLKVESQPKRKRKIQRQSNEKDQSENLEKRRERRRKLLESKGLFKVEAKEDGYKTPKMETFEVEIGLNNTRDNGVLELTQSELKLFHNDPIVLVVINPRATNWLSVRLFPPATTDGKSLTSKKGHGSERRSKKPKKSRDGRTNKRCILRGSRHRKGSRNACKKRPESSTEKSSTQNPVPGKQESRHPNIRKYTLKLNQVYSLRTKNQMASLIVAPSRSTATTQKSFHVTTPTSTEVKTSTDSSMEVFNDYSRTYRIPCLQLNLKDKDRIGPALDICSRGHLEGSFIRLNDISFSRLEYGNISFEQTYYENIKQKCWKTALHYCLLKFCHPRIQAHCLRTFFSCCKHHPREWAPWRPYIEDQIVINKLNKDQSKSFLKHRKRFKKKRRTGCHVKRMKHLRRRHNLECESTRWGPPKPTKRAHPGPKIRRCQGKHSKTDRGEAAREIRRSSERRKNKERRRSKERKTSKERRRSRERRRSKERRISRRMRRSRERWRSKLRPMSRERKRRRGELVYI